METAVLSNFAAKHSGKMSQFTGYEPKSSAVVDDTEMTFDQALDKLTVQNEAQQQSAGMRRFHANGMESETAEKLQPHHFLSNPWTRNLLMATMASWLKMISE